MKKLLELRQQKATLTEQMRSLLTKAEAEKRSLSEDEAKQFDTRRQRLYHNDYPITGSPTPSPNYLHESLNNLTPEEYRMMNENAEISKSTWN
ncbi:phage capsid protein [Xenorhabdus mauleonii]|uniref:Phage capsid protein n=1 Tax=Xenorhabdus mauleonii TaxID=351675 RepID=A0A1I3XRV1_9GAMM|nr:phage capsid protein [Xenorhabdus mauleonii]SFK22254.1 hypothetical protein SAMN05421680_1386 [Xenorhabdus mauleonii]